MKAYSVGLLLIFYTVCQCDVFLYNVMLFLGNKIALCQVWLWIFDV